MENRSGIAHEMFSGTSILIQESPSPDPRVNCAEITLHTILLGVRGTICTAHTLDQFKKLGIDPQKFTKLSSWWRGLTALLSQCVSFSLIDVGRLSSAYELRRWVVMFRTGSGVWGSRLHGIVETLPAFVAGARCISKSGLVPVVHASFSLSARWVLMRMGWRVCLKSERGKMHYQRLCLRALVVLQVLQEYLLVLVYWVLCAAVAAGRVPKDNELYEGKVVVQGKGCQKRKEKKRKDYASQVQLRALRKGPLISKLARASPRRFTEEAQPDHAMNRWGTTSEAQVGRCQPCACGLLLAMPLRVKPAHVRIAAEILSSEARACRWQTHNQLFAFASELGRSANSEGPAKLWDEAKWLWGNVMISGVSTGGERRKP
eukprot:1141214-Pelagomonas_calceolata.AAC.1